MSIHNYIGCSVPRFAGYPQACSNLEQPVSTRVNLSYYYDIPQHPTTTVVYTLWKHKYARHVQYHAVFAGPSA